MIVTSKCTPAYIPGQRADFTRSADTASIPRLSKDETWDHSAASRSASCISVLLR